MRRDRSPLLPGDRPEQGAIKLRKQNMKNTEIQTALRVANEAAIELTVALKNAHRLACGDETKLLGFVLLDILHETAKVQARIEQIREATR